MAAGERETDPVAVDLAADRALELLRALVSGDIAAALFEREAMRARPVHEGDAQLPFAGDLRPRRAGRLRPVGQRGAQGRDDRVADLRRLARLQLERVDRERIVGRAVVVEHHARLAVEHREAQPVSVERKAPAGPRRF